MKIYDAATIAKEIGKFCISTNKKFLFIAGNGASGKTELGKIISKGMAKHGNVNFLEMDDFVVDTTVRNSATLHWEDIQNRKQTGRCTTSMSSAYFLPSIQAILHNIEKGNDYYHWPKKAKKPEECVMLYGDAILTIVEGVGTVFLEKEKSNSLSIFLLCEKELEIARRTQRARADNEKTLEEIEKSFGERNSQYEAIVKPYMPEYDLVLESMQDFSLDVVRDDLDVLK